MNKLKLYLLILYENCDTKQAREKLGWSKSYFSQIKKSLIQEGLIKEEGKSLVITKPFEIQIGTDSLVITKQSGEKSLVITKPEGKSLVKTKQSDTKSLVKTKPSENPLQNNTAGKSLVKTKPSEEKSLVKTKPQQSKANSGSQASLVKTKPLSEDNNNIYNIYNNNNNKKNSTEIKFDGSHLVGWELFLDKLQAAYPNIDIQKEIKKMELWLIANPRKRKKNYLKFIQNWLSRASPRIKKIDTQPSREYGETKIKIY